MKIMIYGILLLFLITPLALANGSTPFATYTTTISERNHIYVSFQREGFRTGTLTLILNDEVFQKVAKGQGISQLEYLYFLLRGFLGK